MQTRRASILIWTTLVIMILVLSFINIPKTDYEVIGLGAVILHSIITLILLQLLVKSQKAIFMFAFIIRVIFLFIDLYARDVFPLMHSGADSEMYYRWAVRISENLSLLSEKSGGIYSRLIGRLFYLIGPIRIFAQYINVLLGLMVVMILSEIFYRLRINYRAARIALIVASFFPTSIIMSAIFLREIVPTFFVALSLLFIIKWYQKAEGWQYIILSILFLGIAAMFHSGVIGLLIGYAFLFMFYDIKSKALAMKPRSIAMFAGLSIFLLLFMLQFGDAMFYKFESIEEMDNLLATGMSELGSSSYLKGVQINNPLQFILYAPIRAFYFLYSPLPMNWRGLGDLVGFFIDALFYIWVTYYYFKNRKYFKGNPLITALIVAIIGAALIYGIGVSNAGTAMRHRQKLIPVFITLVAVMMNLRNRKLKLKR